MIFLGCLFPSNIITPKQKEKKKKRETLLRVCAVLCMYVYRYLQIKFTCEYEAVFVCMLECLCDKDNKQVRGRRRFVRRGEAGCVSVDVCMGREEESSKKRRGGSNIGSSHPLLSSLASVTTKVGRATICHSTCGCYVVGMQRCECVLV